MSDRKNAGFPVIIKRALACLDLAALLVIPVIAFLMYLTMMAPGFGPLAILNLLLYIGIWSLFLAYGLSAVHGISDGIRDFGVGSQYGARVMAGVHGLVIVAPAGGLVYITRGIEPLLLQLVIDALLLFWVPASVLILARTRSWWTALNPVHITKVIADLGIAYWQVLIVSDLMIGLALSMSGEVSDTLFRIGLMLALLVSFSLIGAAAYTRRAQLGHVTLATETLAEVGKSEVLPSEHEFVRQCKIIEREQGVEAAAEFLHTELKQLFAPPEVHDYLLKLLQQAGQIEKMSEHGRQMIQQHLENSANDEGLKVATICLEAEPDFCLRNLEADDVLIELATTRSRNDLVLKLCKSYIKQFGRYGRSVDHSLTAANLLNERYVDPQGARELLLDAIKRGAEGERLEKVQAMLKTIH